MRDTANPSYDSDKNSGNGKHVDSEQQRHLNKLEHEQVMAELKAKQTMLENDLKANLEKQIHQQRLEIRAKEQEVVLVIVKGVQGAMDKCVEIYERVHKTKLTDREATNRMILELAKISPELAKEYIRNANAELASEAASAASSNVMRELAHVLQRAGMH